ncbi:MAG: RsfS/YbeB/iojap family protein, partial [Clostridia bacterium]|nr:RsfS/YbeB/iojap family protein [Clostridia bacterium]
EGVNGAAWILMDYGDVVVHIFDHESASFYNLERLWADAPKLDIQF